MPRTELETRATTPHVAAPTTGGGWSVLRARQWWYFLALPAMGLPPRGGSVGELVLAGVVAGGCLGFAYGINAIVERGTDDSTRKNPLAGRAAVPERARLAVTSAAVVAIVLAVVLGTIAVTACVVSLVSGLVYSAGPRAKHFPFAGLFANLVIFAPLAGLLLDRSPMPSYFPFLHATFCALLLQNQLVHERTDEREDARAGAMTTARFLGARGTCALIWTLSATGALLAHLLAARVELSLAALALLAAGALIAGAARPTPRHRVAHRIVSAGGGVALFGALWTGLV